MGQKDWWTRLQSSPVTVRAYAIVTIAALLRSVGLLTGLLSGVWLAAGIVVVVAVLNGSVRGWAFGVVAAGSTVVYGVAETAVLGVAYGVAAAALLLAPPTLRWVRPSRSRFEVL